jgi:hypothetical protein
MAVRGVLEIELGWSAMAESSQRHTVAKPALVLSMRTSYPEGTLPVGATGAEQPALYGGIGPHGKIAPMHRQINRNYDCHFLNPSRCGRAMTLLRAGEEATAVPEENW